MKLEALFSKYARKPKELLSQIKRRHDPHSTYGFPAESLGGVNSKLLEAIQGNLNRELRRRNKENVSALLAVLYATAKYQIEDLDEPLPMEAVRLISAMTVMYLEAMADSSLVWIRATEHSASLVSLLAEYKSEGFEKCVLPLMKLSQKGQLNIEARVKVSNAINEAWDLYSSKVKVDLQSAGHIANHCKLWLKSLPKAGDYELQLQLLEAVFRLTDSKTRAVLSKTCFANQSLAEEFLKIEPKELDVGSRSFLNVLNSSQGASASVSSLPCLTFVLGTETIPKPADTDAFWIDFNFESKSLSTYVEECIDKSDENPTWIDVVVKSNYVSTYRIQATQESIVLLIMLNDSTPQLIPWLPNGGSPGATLRITFHGQYYDQLSKCVEKLFGGLMVSPQLKLSTTAVSDHSVCKRKVSQAPVYVVISSKKNYAPVCTVTPARNTDALLTCSTQSDTKEDIKKKSEKNGVSPVQSISSTSANVADQSRAQREQHAALTSRESHLDSSNKKSHPAGFNSKETHPRSSSKETHPRFSSKETHPRSNNKETYPRSNNKETYPRSSSKETHSRFSSKETHPQLNKETHPQSNNKETHPQSSSKETHSRFSSKETHPQLNKETHPQSNKETHPRTNSKETHPRTNSKETHPRSNNREPHTLAVSYSKPMEAEKQQTEIAHTDVPQEPVQAYPAVVRISPIYSSPHKRAAPCQNTVPLTPDRRIPAFSARTSTPKESFRLLGKNSSRAESPGRSPRQARELTRESIGADFNQVESSPFTMRASPAPQVTRPTVVKNSTAKANRGAKLHKPNQDRKPLANISNNKWRLGARQKKGTVAPEPTIDTQIIELDVVQDSMPIVDRIPKKRNPKPAVKSVHKNGPVKKSKSPTWLLSTTARSLTCGGGGSANVSRVSSIAAVERDPYQFTSDDQPSPSPSPSPSPQQRPRHSKPSPKPPKMWHERDTIVKSNKKVYTKKGKVQESFDISFQQYSIDEPCENSPPVREIRKPTMAKNKGTTCTSKPRKSGKRLSMPPLSEVDIEDLDLESSSDESYLPSKAAKHSKNLPSTNGKGMKNSTTKRVCEKNKQNKLMSDQKMRNATALVPPVSEVNRGSSSKDQNAKEPYLNAFKSPAEVDKLTCSHVNPRPDKARAPCKKDSIRTSHYPPAPSPVEPRSQEPQDAGGPTSSNNKASVSAVISLPYPDLYSYNAAHQQNANGLATPRDQAMTPYQALRHEQLSSPHSGLQDSSERPDQDLSSPCSRSDSIPNCAVDSSPGSKKPSSDINKATDTLCDSPDESSSLGDITMEFAAHCNKVIAQSERSTKICTSANRQLACDNKQLFEGPNSKSRKRSSAADCTGQTRNKTRKVQDKARTPRITPRPAARSYKDRTTDRPVRQEPDFPRTSAESMSLPPSDEYGCDRFQKHTSPYKPMIKSRPSLEQNSMLHVVQSAAKTTHKHASKLWKLQSGEWNSLVTHYSGNLSAIVSTFEEDVDTTCRTLGSMQKIISSTDTEHQKLMQCLNVQENKLQDLSVTQHSLKQDCSKTGVSLSKKRATLNGTLKKEVDVTLKEFSAKSQQDGMERIRHSVQSWLLLNL